MEIALVLLVGLAVNAVVLYAFARFVMAPLVTKTPTEVRALLKKIFHSA